MTDANELAAIRERADEIAHAMYVEESADAAYPETVIGVPRLNKSLLMGTVEGLLRDQDVLLAHVDALASANAELARKLATAEADYATLAAQVARIDAAGDVQIDDLEVSYGEACDMTQVRLTALMAVATLAGIHDRRVREAQQAASALAGNGGA